MGTTAPTDEALLAAGRRRLRAFYLRHVAALLGFFARRTRDPSSPPT